MTAPRALLITGQPARVERQYHNQPDHWAWLAGHLRAADLSTRVMTDDLSMLNAQDLGRFDVILNYTRFAVVCDQWVRPPAPSGQPAKSPYVRW